MTKEEIHNTIMYNLSYVMSHDQVPYQVYNEGALF